ncbi:MAG: hypothetical protein KC503_42450 [Myxococcales bacterium]|nr:hypothetical protein [Myxococcales bacterium]
MTAIKRLTQLVEALETQGGSPDRIHAARCALAFKRSWVDLAAALEALRRSGAYLDWGYEDLLSYCANELGLRGATVDKLLVSYATLNKHAPGRLDDEERPIPSYQALDYFARVTGEPRADGSVPRNAPQAPPSDEVMTRLREAVFDEGHSAQKLRREFDPLVRPRSPRQQQLDALHRAAATTQRLLTQLEEIDGLPDTRRKSAQRALDDLRAQIAKLVAELSEAEAA